MSQRQPTIEIDDQIIARDEIICIVELKAPVTSAESREASRINALKLVDGTLLPLPPHKIPTVINFIDRND